MKMRLAWHIGNLSRRVGQFTWVGAFLEDLAVRLSN